MAVRIPPTRHAPIKETWLRRLRTGLGTAIVATAVVSVPVAHAAVPSPQADVEVRVRQVRDALRPGPEGAARTGAIDERLAFWGNRVGLVVRPAWPNWPNWHNWPNWGNMGPGWPNY